MLLFTLCQNPRSKTDVLLAIKGFFLRYMFDTAYPFQLVDHKRMRNGGVLGSWLYTFISVRRRYQVRDERYEGDIYAIKYYADCHSQSKNKYNLLLKDERPAPIIRTCVNIMLAIYSANTGASFGLIGAYSVNKERIGKIVHEGKRNTQGFRIYQTLMYNFFGQDTFEHSENVEHSAYLLINRQNDPIADFKERAEEMFKQLYLSLVEGEEG